MSSGKVVSTKVLVALLLTGLVAGALVVYKAFSYRQNAIASHDELLEQMTRWSERRILLQRTKTRELLATGARVRVVVFGASITERWPLADHFGEMAIVNQGISGEITSHMLARFETDVLALSPEVAVIAGGGGINQLAQAGPGKQTQDAIVRNVSEMVQRARKRGIGVIVLPVLPTNDSGAPEYWRAFSGIAPVNDHLSKLAAGEGVWYCDLTKPLSGPDGQLKKTFSSDGLHPNDDCYRAMSDAFAPVLEKALGKVGEGGPSGSQE